MEPSSERSPPNERIAVVACDVLGDEVRRFITSARGVVHLELVEQGLHDDPPRLQLLLQQSIERVERTVPDATAIALVYGLCSRGTEGLTARRCKLVLPRAHDCITLLLGDKDRYARYVEQHPGTYWYSPGWNRCHLPPGERRYRTLLEKYTREYGTENAEYLMETEQQWFQTYDRATYVDLGVAATPQDVEYTQACARWLGWQFDRQSGSPALLVDLLSGPWDERRFIVVPPGRSLRFSGTPEIFELTLPPQEPSS